MRIPVRMPRPSSRCSGGAGAPTAGRCWPFRLAASWPRRRRARVSPFSSPDPPVVHFLAGTTGHEEHTIDGLSWPKTADLDGDGMTDLWGSIDGKLCAFRGRLPEPWRVLDRLHAAADFDGDGLTDVLSNDLESHRTGPTEKMESRTAIARSGRDGRILWRDAARSLGRLGFPVGMEKSLSFPFRAASWRGDLDGDGASDVLVARPRIGPETKNRRPIHLPLQALSGRPAGCCGRRVRCRLWKSRPSGNPVIEESDVLACDPRRLA